MNKSIVFTILATMCECSIFGVSYINNIENVTYHIEDVTYPIEHPVGNLGGVDNSILRSPMEIVFVCNSLPNMKLEGFGLRSFTELVSRYSCSFLNCPMYSKSDKQLLVDAVFSVISLCSNQNGNVLYSLVNEWLELLNPQTDVYSQIRDYAAQLNQNDGQITNDSIGLSNRADSPLDEWMNTFQGSAVEGLSNDDFLA
ncbi:MAG: hypothetical protein LBJ89_01470 [Holosporales bacterium]|nr:hypothetical protein [Holosporales bacterium]